MIIYHYCFSNTNNKNYGRNICSLLLSYCNSTNSSDNNGIIIALKAQLRFDTELDTAEG